jgi:hypothetical protein
MKPGVRNKAVMKPGVRNNVITYEIFKIVRDFPRFQEKRFCLIYVMKFQYFKILPKIYRFQARFHNFVSDFKQVGGFQISRFDKISEFHWRFQSK